MNIESKIPSDVVFYKIIVPHDLSRRADKAVQMAGTMAHPLHSEVIVMHVIDPTEGFTNEDISSSDQMTDLARDRWRYLQLLAKRVLPADLKVDVRVLSGDPQKIILAETKNVGADLLIITTNPLKGAGYPFLGGETEHIQFKAPCPVLAIPVTDDDEVSLARQASKMVETHSLRQYCEVSRTMAKKTAHRPVYLGYAHVPANPSGLCE
jgi:nucleotide-binding universal stress UspA family protein